MNEIMEERKNRIISFMREHSYKPLKFEELAVVLDVPEEDHPTKASGRNGRRGALLKHEGRYGVPERMGLCLSSGNTKLQLYVANFRDEDLYIPANAINGAMHGDRVIARLSRHASGDRHQEGEIINIIKRANKTIVGKFDKSEHFGFVTPDHSRLSGDIFIPQDFINGAEKGQKVVVEITNWHEKNRN